MFRSVAFVIILLTASFTGCTDSTPNRTIVTFQIDSDGDDFWIYLYTVPRTKMGNFTIASTDYNDTASSVFSHQKKITLNSMNEDEEGYSFFSFQADLSEVFWELNCKLRLSEDSTEEEIILEVIILNKDYEEEKSEEWKMPYSTPLNHKQ